MQTTSAPTFQEQDLSGFYGRTVVGNDGEKIGKVQDVYMDDDTGRPERLVVEKRRVVRERIIVRKEQVTEQQTVEADLRR